MQRSTARSCRSLGPASPRDSITAPLARPTHHMPLGPRHTCSCHASSPRTTELPLAQSTTTTAPLDKPAVADTAPARSWLQRLLPIPLPGKAPSKTRSLRTITAEELDSLLAAPRSSALLILFSATWCGPCKIMVQRLEALLNDSSLPTAEVVKIDVELEDALATRLKVYKLPTLMVVGLKEDPAHPALRLQGLASSTALVDMVTNRAQHLGANLEEAILW